MSVFLIVASAVTETSSSNDDIKARLFNPLLIITIVITRCRWCYTALYLSMLADLLKDLHILLKQQQLKSFKKNKKIDPLERSKARERIRYFRMIYIQSSRIASLISDSFGWSLIALLIELTFKAINACYWLYINQKFYESNLLSIRETFCFLSYCSHISRMSFNGSLQIFYCITAHCLSFFPTFICCRKDVNVW